MNKTEFFAYLKNYFVCDKLQGDFTIADGTIDVDIPDGQFYRIIGSVFNDGVFSTSEMLVDEKFNGEVWKMAVPPAVKRLIDEIAEWETTNAAAISSPYNSESFGGYSYSKATGADGILSWQSQFGSRLNRWRKICPY